MVRRRPNSLKKTILREIRDSLGRYLAIVGIIALGSGFFTGLKVTKTAMLETGDRYMRSHGFFDYRLVSTLGWDDKNVAAINAMDGIRSAEGSVTLDFIASVDDREFVLKAHCITNYVNLYDLTAGRLPEAADECVLDDYNLSGFSLGDKIRVSHSNSDSTVSSFTYSEYKVVGFVRTPMYINFERGNTTLGNGTVSGFICIPPEGFSTDYYTEIYLTLTDRGYIYSEEYDNALESIYNTLESVANEEALARYGRVISDARGELQSARLEYDDGVNQYNDGYVKYSDGLSAFTDGEDAYNDGVALLYEKRRDAHEELLGGYYTLVDNSAALAEAEAQLDEAERQLDEAIENIYTYAADALTDAEHRLDSAKETIPDNLYDRLKSAVFSARELLDSDEMAIRPEMYQEALSAFDAASAYLAGHADETNTDGIFLAEQTLNYARTVFTDNFGPLYDAYVQIQDGRRQIEDGLGQISVGWQLWNDSMVMAETEFAKGEDELAISRIKLSKAQNELDDAENELADGRAELLDAEQKLNDAEKELNELALPEVYILDRTTNIGYVCFESDSDIVDGIASVFPFFFFAVAALVCVTTMNRMVDDERGQIGTLKALGYGTGAIMSRYLIYTGSASVIGCVIGVTAGSWLFPTVIWTAYMIMYSMPDITIVCDVGLMLLSSLSYLALAMLVTWVSCRNELRQPAAELIRPKSPPAGKRIWLEHLGFIWKRLGFLRKVSLRNVFRYQKRLIMMVLGIGGCTGLLLTGFGLNDSITHIADRQFDEISIYDASVSFTDDMNGDAGTQFLEDCSGAVSDCTFLYSATVTCTTSANTGTVTLVGAEDFDMLNGLVSFHLDGHATPAPGRGECIISKNLADRYDLQPGDTVTLRSGDTDSAELTVTGVFANVIYNYVYATLPTVSDLLGTAPELRAAYVNFSAGMDVHEAAAIAAGCKNVANVSVTDDTRSMVNNMLESMKYVVLLIIGCAAALAFIVLFNLTNINIHERIREIATIKVLGFNSGETGQYVFRENMILAACGCAAGIPMGIWLHNFVMNQIKIDMISFEARRTLMSYLASIALTFIFTAVVNLLMLPSLDRINMTEALKSVE